MKSRTRSRHIVAPTRGLRRVPMWCLALVAVSHVASAQVIDEIRPRRAIWEYSHCYRVRDALAPQIEFMTNDPISDTVDGCRARTRARYLCVPAIADVSSSSAPMSQTFEHTSTAGAAICYKVKCPLQVGADLWVRDRFGLRKLTRLKSRLYCSAVELGRAFDVSLRMTGTTALGALGFRVEISGVRGGFAINESTLAAECNGPDSSTAGVTSVFNASANTLHAALIASPPIEAGTDVATCRFQSFDGELTPANIAVTVADAADEDGNPVSGANVVVSAITPSPE